MVRSGIRATRRLPLSRSHQLRPISGSVKNPARDGTNDWSAAGGDFWDVAKWSPDGYPDDGTDKARFTAVFAVYDVQFDRDETNNDLQVALGSPNLILWDDFPVRDVFHYTLDATTGTAANVP